MKKIKQKKVYRLNEEQNRQKLSSLQVALRAGVVFIFAFSMLFTVFVSAAKLPVKKKVVVLSVPRGASMNIGMPVAKKDKTKLIEICRGAIKPKCTVLAKNVIGVKKTIKIPAVYPMGNATVKIHITTLKDGKTVKTLLSEKKVKITAAITSAGGGGGGSSGGSGGGNSGNGGGSAESGSVETTITLINGGVSTPAPSPVSSGSSSSGSIIIRATPTPTAPLNRTTDPVLLNH